MVPFFNPSSSSQPINRKALFLKPINSSSPPPPPPSVDASTFTGPSLPLYHSEFRWWPDPQPQWCQWVEKLTPKYLPVWQKSGIHLAILSSTYKLSRQSSSLLSLSLFWSQQTNSFIFPWGEATLTLLDVSVLGGFSLLGDTVRLRSPFSGALARMDSRIRADFASFKRNNPSTANQPHWIRHHMEAGDGNDDIEHVAFLSLWLSRFVFAAHNGKSIRERVFHVAVRLAAGIRLALAPAVLASIYRDLRVIRNHARRSTSSNHHQNQQQTLAVWSPVNLLQLWLWERFPALSPRPSSSILPDKPRAARWTSTGRRVDSAIVMSALRSPEGFCWRPYGYDSFSERSSIGWFCSGVSWGDDDDEELQSFVRCLRGCELVGLDCIEQYLPHRVAMQFGFDQDVPGELARVNFTWELAWITYDISSKNVKFYVPPWLHKPDVTLRYFNWWSSSSSSSSKKLMKKRKEAENVPEKKKKKKVKKSGGLSISSCDLKGLKKTNAEETATVESEVGDKKKQFKEETKTDLSPADAEESGKGDKETNSEQVKEKEEKQHDEERRPDPLPTEKEGVTMCLMNTHAEEFGHELTDAGKITGATAEIEERNPILKKELERDLQINRLKREVASIKKQIKYLESLAGVLPEPQIKQLEALAVALVQSRSKR